MTIHVPPGELFEVVAENFIKDSGRNGFTVKLRNGGILSVAIAPGAEAPAQAERPHLAYRSRDITAPEMGEKLRAVLSMWKANPLKSLEICADECGVTAGDARAAFHEGKSHRIPPMRAEYEKALETRKKAYAAREAK